MRLSPSMGGSRRGSGGLSCTGDATINAKVVWSTKAHPQVETKPWEWKVSLELIGGACCLLWSATRSSTSRFPCKLDFKRSGLTAISLTHVASSRLTRCRQVMGALLGNLATLRGSAAASNWQGLNT